MTLHKRKLSIDKNSVAITLFVPLCPKAVETKRKSPILIDTKAVEIIESIDFDTKPYLRKTVYHTAIVRTYLIDIGVKKFIHDNPEGVIINLGCGLDTRTTRMDNGKIKWYDLDLPEVIELRGKFFDKNERITFIAKSVTDYSWIHDIKITGNEKILIIAEGLFHYLKDIEIREIFQQLAKAFPNSEMYLTVIHKFLVGKKITEGITFSWGIGKTEEIEKINDKIKLIEFWRLSDFFKNRQNPIMRLFSLISPVGKNITRVLHIKFIT